MPPSLERRFDLLAIGDPVLDVVMQAESLPRWDDKQLGQSGHLMPGGCEANAACAASQLGARSAVFGQLGDGLDSRILLQDFMRFGVCTDHVAIQLATSTATAIVYVSPAGERAISYAPAKPQVPRWEALEQAIAQSRWVYLLPYDVAWATRVAELARKHNTAVAVDLERAVVEAAGSFQALAPLADCIFFNEGGFVRATRQMPTVARAGALLQSCRAQTVVVTLGPRGALAVDRASQRVQISAYPAKLCDTTGAGDAFNGAFLAASVRGANLHAAVDQACAAASLCIERRGARAGLPTLSELTVHMACHSSRRREGARS
jgi:sugar/nucleoside kinase (ribokinase family)